MSWRTWGEFRLEAFGDPYMVWHDGPDFASLVEHWRADPAEIERMLHLGIAEGDALAAQAIGELPLPAEGSPALVALLEEALPAAGGDSRVRIAEALHRMTGRESWSEQIVAVLGSGGHWGVRLDAAIALAAFAPTPALISALAAGVRDPEYLVRFHSSDTLLRYAGRSGQVSDDPALFELITADGSGSWAQAAEQLSAAASAALPA
jgi:hypothetical protein